MDSYLCIVSTVDRKLRNPYSEYHYDQQRDPRVKTIVTQELKADLSWDEPCIELDPVFDWPPGLKLDPLRDTAMALDFPHWWDGELSRCLLM